MRAFSLFAFFLVGIAGSGSAGAAEPLRGIWVPVGADQADIVEPTGHTSKVIYLNRCRGGCEILPGYNDAQSDHSTIPHEPSTLSEFRHSDRVWENVVSCVRRVYEPYDIVITEEDPGEAEHFEAMVAGLPGDLGLSSRIGGIAPGGCGVVNNSITFSFANATTDVDQICWIVAQETAHSFGLDHEFLCEDPMTYLAECGTSKTFQDEDARCGEDRERDCYCGGATQNSHRQLLAHFGAGEFLPPEVAFARPAENAVVRPGFPIEAAASDDIEIRRVELWIGGQKVAETQVAPYVFNAPEELRGPVELELRAYDNREGEARASLAVTVDELMAFGGACAGDGDCATGRCIDDGKGLRLCTQACDAESSCPATYACVPEGAGSLCWPEAASERGGCILAPATSTAAAGGWLLVLALLRHRRRRAR